MQRNRCKSVWRRKKSQTTKIGILQDDPSFDQLRTVSKRLAIMSRMQKKQQKPSNHKLIPNTYSNLDISLTNPQPHSNPKPPKRPATTSYNRQQHDITHIRQAYRHEKRITDNLMAEKYESTLKTNATNVTGSVKEGLLGEYDRYNEMSKHELIEKLISLEYLANGIYRKNKVLEERIRVLDPNFKIN